MKSPVGGRHRFLCHCYNAKGEYTTLASAAPNYHDFQVPEGTTRVVYTMQDGGQAQLGQWIWNGEKWLSLDLPEGADCLAETVMVQKIKKVARKARKPAPKKVEPKQIVKSGIPGPRPDGISQELWLDALTYTQEYNKRFTSVKQAFAKVTK